MAGIKISVTLSPEALEILDDRVSGEITRSKVLEELLLQKIPTNGIVEGIELPLVLVEQLQQVKGYRSVNAAAVGAVKHFLKIRGVVI